MTSPSRENSKGAKLWDRALVAALFASSGLAATATALAVRQSMAFSRSPVVHTVLIACLALVGLGTLIQLARFPLVAAGLFMLPGGVLLLWGMAGLLVWPIFAAAACIAIGGVSLAVGFTGRIRRG